MHFLVVHTLASRSFPFLVDSQNKHLLRLGLCPSFLSVIYPWPWTLADSDFFNTPVLDQVSQMDDAVILQQNLAIPKNSIKFHKAQTSPFSLMLIFLALNVKAFKKRFFDFSLPSWNLWHWLIIFTFPFSLSQAHCRVLFLTAIHKAESHKRTKHFPFYMLWNIFYSRDEQFGLMPPSRRLNFSSLEHIVIFGCHVLTHINVCKGELSICSSPVHFSFSSLLLSLS